MKKKLRKVLLLVMSCAMLAGSVPAFAADSSRFPDVPQDAWYAQQLEQMMKYTPGLFSGYEDGSFKPDNFLKRGEFLRLAMTAADGYTADSSRNGIHWAAKYYTIAMENNVLVSDVYTGGIMFPCTWEELEKPVTRYEMAVIINNVCTNMLMEKTVIVEEAAACIPDYEAISTQYVNAVEQAYGKGILNGFVNTEGIADGSFGGDRNLLRSQAVLVIYKMLWAGDRKLASFAEAQQVPTSTDAAPEGFVSFATWLRGHMDAYGNLDADARTALFGSAGKTYFRNASDAAAYMTTITVPVWTVDKTGQKVASTASLTVHKLVSAEVGYIFQEIFDDPEQFPIYGGWSVGGARYTDTMRHSWGCAIDVNAYYNCECTINWNTKANNVTCGYGWWPMGHADASFAGSMKGQSPYSIGASEGEYGYSVVRAFAKYGWGWGGNGYSLKSNGNQKFDFMHFSVLPSGG